jgi:hypothetical protein
MTETTTTPTVAEQAGFLAAALDTALSELEGDPYVELEALESHPDEPSTVTIRGHLDTAKKALENATALCQAVESGKTTL